MGWHEHQFANYEWGPVRDEFRFVSQFVPIPTCKYNMEKRTMYVTLSSLEEGEEEKSYQLMLSAFRSGGRTNRSQIECWTWSEIPGFRFLPNLSSYYYFHIKLLCG